MKQKQQTWTKFRHRVITSLVRVFFTPYVNAKYHIKVDRFKEQGDRQYLVLFNHQTAYDQFFVGLSFRHPVYYMATEDIFSMGWVSDVIRYVVAPIPIRKQTTDIAAIRSCVRVAKESGTIALAPEGNRTYSGRTEYINPSIVSLIRMLKLPVAVFRIEGGYGVQPRWSGEVRKGKMHAYVSEVIEPETWSELSNDELYARIVDGLAVNENCLSGEFPAKAPAEFLDRAIYVCPECGLSTFHSQGDILRCTKCGKETRYLPTKELQGVNWDCPFRFVADWYDYEKDYVNSLDTHSMTETPLFTDTARLSRVIVFKHKEILRETSTVTLYGDRVVVDEGKPDELLLPFSQVSAVVCLGPNKLNIYHGEDVYQFKGDKHFNSLKYTNLFHRYQNIAKGEAHVKFLGL